MDQIVNKVKAQLFAKGVDNMQQLQDVFLVSQPPHSNILRPLRSFWNPALLKKASSESPGLRKETRLEAPFDSEIDLNRESQEERKLKLSFNLDPSFRL